ncbi:MAG: cupredoxin domain-containing protein [Nanoarchaeota archaeon]
MKKIILIVLILSILVISACSSQGGEQIVGQGSGVTEQTPASTQSGDFKEFTITAKQFEFVPSTIEVNKGDKVRLVVTSVDVPHGLAIPEYGINQRLEPGKPETIEFTADKVGTFTTYCSVVCGSGHKSMKGQLIVK